MDPLRQQAVLTAAAYACIHLHPRAYSDPSMLSPFWTGPGEIPTRKQMRLLAPPGGYRQGVVRRIKAGLEDEHLFPWTGGFWYGLKLSGALKYSNERWLVGHGRPELIEDLSRLPVAKQLSHPDQRGRHSLRECLALHLPHKGEDDPMVLAGLLAGARHRSTSDGREYFCVDGTKEVREWLDHWALAIHNHTRHGYGLSPFYVALLMPCMPPACACRVFAVRKAAQCPLLPLAYWEVLFGDEGVPLPPKAWALPFACSDVTRKRHHWTHRTLHRTAIQLGIAHVPPAMRQLIVDFRRNREMLSEVRFAVD